MSFSYYDKDNNIKRLNIEVGKEWSSYKEKEENSLLNSVFDAVDQNSDGKVDKEELNILQKLLKIADSQIDKFKNNNIIEKDELEILFNKINTQDLESLEHNHNPSQITPKIINIPDDISKLKNYTYLSTYKVFGEDEEGNDDKIKVEKFIVDYSNLKNLEAGKYHIDSWKEVANNDDILTIIPVFRKISESNQDGTQNWSEGINRNISKIQFDKTGCSKKLFEFMKKVGEEQGFTIELLDGCEGWIEDYGVVRFDKKQVIPNCDSNFVMSMYDNENKIINSRKKISYNKQGSAAQKENTDKAANAIRYSHVVSLDDIIQGKTYLEGGNVLNTLTKNGEPGAIIGEESIKYTMCAILGLDIEDACEREDYIKQALKDYSEDNINKVKRAIAEELGIKEENVTYIPQFDFHIDMHYRPLNDGQVAVPDYEAGINILKKFIQDIDKKLELNTEQSSNLEAKKEEYSKLIVKLEDMKTKTAEISLEAENELQKQGYEIVKIPCFTDIDRGIPFEKTVENAINYMNGICGTSAKTGDKFYITNTSGDEALDAYMENYFKEVVGFDKVYFAPTKKYLNAKGGIDCLTKEF